MPPRKKLKYTFVPLPVQHLGCTTRPRTPVAGSFKAGTFSFTLVGAHLRADGDRGCGRALLRAQVRTGDANNIMAYLVSHRRAKMIEPDRILLDDPDVEPGVPSSVPLQTRGLKLMTSPGKLSPISGCWSYRHCAYSHALDRLLVSAPAEREVVPRSAEYPAKFSEINALEISTFRPPLSDHSPVCARFRTHLGG